MSVFVTFELQSFQRNQERYKLLKHLLLFSHKMYCLYNNSIGKCNYLRLCFPISTRKMLTLRFLILIMKKKKNNCISMITYSSNKNCKCSRYWLCRNNWIFRKMTCTSIMYPWPISRKLLWKDFLRFLTKVSI